MYYQVSGRARDNPTVSYINFLLCPFSHWYYRASVDTALPLGQPIVGVDGQEARRCIVVVHYAPEHIGAEMREKGVSSRAQRQGCVRRRHQLWQQPCSDRCVLSL